MKQVRKKVSVVTRIIRLTCGERFENLKNLKNWTAAPDDGGCIEELRRTCSFRSLLVYKSYFASVIRFLYQYQEAFGMTDNDIIKLEKSLEGAGKSMQKMADIEMVDKEEVMMSSHIAVQHSKKYLNSQTLATVLEELRSSASRTAGTDLVVPSAKFCEIRNHLILVLALLNAGKRSGVYPAIKFPEIVPSPDTDGESY